VNRELSIKQVVERYTSTVYGVALTHTARRADADDVFQEVFFAYWRCKPDVTSQEHLKAWLIRTTLNFCLKSTQSSWAKKTLYLDGEREPDPKELGSVELPSSDFSFQTEQQTELYMALSALPTAYRAVLQMFYFEDLSIAHIAQTLGEEQGAIKTRLSRARSKLREKLKEGVGDDREQA